MDDPERSRGIESMVLKEQVLSEFSRPVPSEYLGLIVPARFEGDLLSDSPKFNDLVRIPEIEIPNRDLKLEDANLTERGQLFKELVEGRDFWDLGCGDPQRVWAVRVISKALGAKRYLGVDAAALGYSFRNDPDYASRRGLYEEKRYSMMDRPGFLYAEKSDSFEEVWIEDDMLAAVSKLASSDNRLFYLSNIEFLTLSRVESGSDESYVRALWHEISRVSNRGSGIVFNNRNIGITEGHLDELESRKHLRHKYLSEVGYKYATGGKTSGVGHEFFIKE